MKLRQLLLALLLFSVSDQADEITGYVKVVDGDSLEINGQRIRRKGVDAPDLWVRNVRCCPS